MKYPVATSDRRSLQQTGVSRDEQRLKQRAAFAAKASSFAEDIVMELNGTRTIVCVMFLLLVGASLTTSYLLTTHPECFGHRLKENLKNQVLPGEMPMLRSGSALGSIESAKQKSEEQQGIDGSLQCTAAQLTRIQKQLPGSSCEGNPWLQKCSLTKATTKGCHDPIWVRQFFASATLSTPFKSLFVDYNPSDSLLSDFPMDALYFGSHNAKYDIRAWRGAAKVDEACKKAVEVGREQSAQSIVVVKDVDAMKTTRAIKEELGLTDDEMWLAHMNTGSNTVVRKFIAEKFPGNDPIHYLKVNGGYNFLASWFSAKGLSKAWYLEFTVNWVDEWTTGDLGLLLKSLLPKSGFTCYWAGTNGNLWRIAGCWQEHYSFKTWANVACVNTQIAETKPLFDKMEALFEQTLATEQLF
jgi:hypothetical protein